MGLSNSVFIGLRKDNPIEFFNGKSTDGKTLFADAKLIDGRSGEAAVNNDEYINGIHHPDCQSF